MKTNQQKLISEFQNLLATYPEISNRAAAKNLRISEGAVRRMRNKIGPSSTPFRTGTDGKKYRPPVRKPDTEEIAVLSRVFEFCIKLCADTPSASKNLPRVLRKLACCFAKFNSK